MTTIDSFTGEYAFLSNFYSFPFKYNGLVYATSEHAYQQAKTVNPIERQRVRDAATAGGAKKVGRFVTLRPDWDTKWKYVEMMRILLAKFESSWMIGKLQETSGAILVEGNTWHDNVWGVCWCDKCGRNGKNMLGIMLMLIRDAL